MWTDERDVFILPIPEQLSCGYWGARFVQHPNMSCRLLQAVPPPVAPPVPVVSPIPSLPAFPPASAGPCQNVLQILQSNPSLSTWLSTLQVGHWSQGLGYIMYTLKHKVMICIAVDRVSKAANVDVAPLFNLKSSFKIRCHQKVNTWCASTTGPRLDLHCVSSCPLMTAPQHSG